MRAMHQRVRTLPEPRSAPTNNRQGRAPDHATDGRGEAMARPHGGAIDQAALPAEWSRLSSLSSRSSGTPSDGGTPSVPVVPRGVGCAPPPRGT